MLESCLVVVGVLISDLALAWLDPRIRFAGGQTR
jgi:ABC-type dipeptide/oligopeptide/nickel transport system permease component